LESTYWEAWERSKENAETSVIRDTPQGRFHEERSVGQSGNPAFLEGVLKCVNKRCELLGLDAPKKIAPTDPTGEKEYVGLTDDERAARIAAILDAARARRDGQSHLE
jgi:hypothetical protein